MAGEKSLYLVARGSYTDPTLSAEIWQFGLRLFCDLSSPDPVGTFPTTGDFIAADAGSTSDGFHIHTSWRWLQGVDPVIEPVDYLHDQAMPAFVTFMASNACSSKVQLDQLRLYPMLGGGHAFDSRVAVGVYDTPPVGSRSGDMVPTELSAVVSTRTSRPGPKGRGRFYVPPATVSAISSTGFVHGTYQGDLADAAQALLEDLALGTPVVVEPCVSGGTLTQYSIINVIDVGNVWDAQRRRRQSLVESRTSRAPAYP